MKQIFLGLTTTPGSDWREKIKEINRFEIKEIALFPTYLVPEQRQEPYALLEKTDLENIIFTHLRSEDMGSDEINYLQKQFHCELFNIHANKNRIILSAQPELEKFRNQIYVENAGDLDPLEEFAKHYAGLCIDFAHWEAGKLQKDESYKLFPETVKKFEVGFAHISAVREKPIFVSWDEKHKPHYDLHTLDDLKQLDYLKKYAEYLPDILGIELENSFEEQLNIKKYLEEMINGK